MSLYIDLTEAKLNGDYKMAAKIEEEIEKINNTKIITNIDYLNINIVDENNKFISSIKNTSNINYDQIINDYKKILNETYNNFNDKNFYIKNNIDYNKITKLNTNEESPIYIKYKISLPGNILLSRYMENFSYYEIKYRKYIINLNYFVENFSKFNIDLKDKIYINNLIMLFNFLFYYYFKYKLVDLNKIINKFIPNNDDNIYNFIKLNLDNLNNILKVICPKLDYIGEFIIN